MANYANAKATIAANIYTNHLGKVTAEMVKTAADAIVDTLIAGGYLYAGVAHPGDAAVSPDANVFYIASEPGTYTNKGGLIVADGEVAVLKYNGSWSKEATGAATAEQVNQLGQQFTMGSVITPTTIPQSPKEYHFYIGGSGVYPSPISATIQVGAVGVFYYRPTGWSVERFYFDENENFINVNLYNRTYNSYQSLVGARVSIPTRLRHKGLIMTALVSGKWKTQINIDDSDWANNASWLDFGIVKKITLSSHTYLYNGDTILFEIINDLTTGGTGNVLSAEMGKSLKSELTKEINGIVKGVSYNNASDSKQLNIDIENSQCVIGDTPGATAGYIAFADGNYIAFKQGTTTFTKDGFGIYFLYFYSDDQLFYIKKYTDMSSLDYTKVKILGLITLDSSGLLVYDGISFAHKINGKRVVGRIQNPLEGKKLSILGDSISTYAGYIPSGNAAFYPRENYNVNDVRYTWWDMLLKATGMILEVNDSWSGSRIATPPAGRTEKAFTNSDRYSNLGTPDVIIVFGGINDEFAQANPTEIGEYNFIYTNPATLDLTKLKQAYQFLVEKLQNLYPNAKVFLCTQTFRGNLGVFQEYNNNGIAQYQLHDIVRDVAKFYGCGLIDLAKCGINTQNFSNYLSDSIHPNRTGMKLIYEKVLASLNGYYGGNTIVNQPYV